MKEKIILGLGNNIDYEIVWNSQVFENLIVKYDIRDKELSTDIVVNSERDLIVSILGFLKFEKGGERFVSTSEIIEVLANKFEKKITLGGTSVRAAIAMRKLGYTSALHLVTINDHVRNLVPQDSPYVCSTVEENAYPHLIVQFCRGARVKALDIDICASHANRIIYDNDYDNIAMVLNEGFIDLITEAKVFLISGFNAMQSNQLLAERLQTLLKIIEALPKDAYVFYEDACFYNVSFSKQVRDALINNIDIYSLNEDELQEYLDKELDLLNPEQIKEALSDIRQLIPAPLIVVHTRYWVLAYGENAISLSKALKGGVTMAGTRFRFGDDFTEENYQETDKLTLQKEGVTFAKKINKLLGNKVCCLACVQAEETNVTTIGLGDSFVGGFLPALIS